MKKIDKTELHNIFIELKNNKESSFNDLYTKYNDTVNTNCLKRTQENGTI